MGRQIVMAAFCVVATIAFAWIIDHPAKVGGTVITLIAFAIIVAVARFRGESTTQAAKWNSRRRSGQTKP